MRSILFKISKLSQIKKPRKLYSDLTDAPDAFYINKTHANSFYNTGLKELLSQLSVKSIEICGAQTQFCIDTTVKVAHSLGYKIYMKKKCYNYLRQLVYVCR